MLETCPLAFDIGEIISRNYTGIFQDFSKLRRNISLLGTAGRK
ncbi:MAG: hypothetical protein WB014_08910 [Methanosarcina sp.]